MVFPNGNYGLRMHYWHRKNNCNLMDTPYPLLVCEIEGLLYYILLFILSADMQPAQSEYYIGLGAAHCQTGPHI
jgi:hypothetical protein